MLWYTLALINLDWPIKMRRFIIEHNQKPNLQIRKKHIAVVLWPFKLLRVDGCIAYKAFVAN
jgi:hypothetical protein